MRLLVVEDDDVLLDGLRVGLQLAGFTVDAVTTLEDAKRPSTVAVSTPSFST